MSTIGGDPALGWVKALLIVQLVSVTLTTLLLAAICVRLLWGRR